MRNSLVLLNLLLITIASFVVCDKLQTKFISKALLKTSTISNELKNLKENGAANTNVQLSELSTSSLAHSNYRLDITYTKEKEHQRKSYLVHTVPDYAKLPMEQKQKHIRVHQLNYNKFLLINLVSNRLGTSPELLSIRDDVYLFEWVANYQTLPANLFTENNLLAAQEDVISKVASLYNTMHSLLPQQIEVAADKLFEMQAQELVFSPSKLVASRISHIEESCKGTMLKAPKWLKSVKKIVVDLETKIQAAFDFDTTDLDEMALIYNNGLLSNFLLEEQTETKENLDSSLPRSIVNKMKEKGFNRSLLLVDMEYSGLFYDRFYDLANFAVANELSPKQELALIDNYLKLSHNRLSNNKKATRAHKHVILAKHQLYKIIARVLDATKFLSQHFVLGENATSNMDTEHWLYGMQQIQKVQRIISSTQFEKWEYELNSF